MFFETDLWHFEKCSALSNARMIDQISRFLYFRYERQLVAVLQLHLKNDMTCSILTILDRTVKSHRHSYNSTQNDRIPLNRAIQYSTKSNPIQSNRMGPKQCPHRRRWPIVCLLVEFHSNNRQPPIPRSSREQYQFKSRQLRHLRCSWSTYGWHWHEAGLTICTNPTSQFRPLSSDHWQTQLLF